MRKYLELFLLPVIVLGLEILGLFVCGIILIPFNFVKDFWDYNKEVVHKTIVEVCSQFTSSRKVKG